MEVVNQTEGGSPLRDNLSNTRGHEAVRQVKYKTHIVFPPNLLRPALRIHLPLIFLLLFKRGFFFFFTEFFFSG
jgi:hypothetical protein